MAEGATFNSPRALFFQEEEPGTAPEGSFWVRRTDYSLFTYDSSIPQWVPVPALPPGSYGFSGSLEIERVEWEDPDLVKYVRTLTVFSGSIFDVSDEVRSVILTTIECVDETTTTTTTTTTETTTTTTTTTTTESTTTTTTTTTGG